jgi:hypothetical protein
MRSPKKLVNSSSSGEITRKNGLIWFVVELAAAGGTWQQSGSIGFFALPQQGTGVL